MLGINMTNSDRFPSGILNINVNTGLTPNGRLVDNTSDANAIRWIEIRRNLDALQLMRKTVKEDESSIKAYKRLVRHQLTSAGFYLDQIDYAQSMADVDKVVHEAVQWADAKVMELWKPGMPGYGIEGIRETFEWILNKRLYHGTEQNVEILKPLGVNMGHKWAKPEWAIFFWDERSLARKWAIYQACRRVGKSRLLYHIPSGGFLVDHNDADILISRMKGTDAYVYEAVLPRLKVGYGASPAIREFTYAGEVKPSGKDTIKIDEETILEAMIPSSPSEMSKYLSDLSKGKFNSRRGLIFKWIMDPDRDFERHKYHKLVRDGKLSPGDPLDNISFESVPTTLKW